MAGLVICAQYPRIDTKIQRMKDRMAKAGMVLAQGNIDDDIIERIRGNVLARDLVFEKVSDDAPVSTSGGTRKEKAMYVATPDRTSNARVVVDLTLKHQ